MAQPVIQTVMHAVSVLEFVVEKALFQEGASLAEIADKLQIQRTSACNLLSTLEYAGYLTKVGRGNYRPGMKCAMLASGATMSALLPQALPILSELASSTGETAILNALFNGDRQVLAQVSGSAKITVSQNVELEQDRFYRRATTRCMLASASPAMLAAVQKKHEFPPEKHWPGLQKSPARLNDQLQGIRKGKRVCVTDDEVCGLAVTVDTGAFPIPLSLGVSMPAFRHTPAAESNIFQSLQAASTRLSALLG